jgi:hypothetical protein
MFLSLAAIRDRHYDGILKCADCSNGADFTDAIAEFRSDADSLHDDVNDLTAELSDEARDALQDTLSDILDSIEDRCADFVDGTAEEWERADAARPEVDIEMDGISRATYRGRDNGADQWGVLPSITYHSSFGLFAGLQAAMMSSDPSFVDEEAATIGFDLRLGDWGKWGISYSRMWFNSQSKQVKSDLPNVLDATAEIRPGALLLAFSPSYAFGSKHEWTIDILSGYEFESESLIRNATVSVTPSVLFTAGEQDQSLAASRVAKVTKKGTTKTTTTITNKVSFSALDYDLFVPIQVESGRWTVSVQPTCSIPVNVIDSSSKDPFFSVLCSISYAIKLGTPANRIAP